MEGEVQTSPQLSYPIDTSDPEYVSRLSAILVATIQETKDSISQIEYIFCNQLYPDFQLKSKTLQKIYSEAKQEWKEKEKDMLIKIETLQFKKQKVLEENQYLKLENRKLDNIQRPSPKCVKELEEENHLLQKKNRILDLEAEELRWELRSKNKIIEEKVEVQTKLLQLVQSKVSLIAQKEQKLKENDEKTIELLANLKSLENEIGEVRRELQEKTEQVDKGKELQESLLNKIELQASESGNKRQLLNDFERENRLLTGQLRILEDKFNELQKEVQKKSEEVEEGRKMQQLLIQQNDSNSSEMLKTRKDLEELKKERTLLLDKLKVLEEKATKLQVELKERSNESTEGMELHGQLLRQIEGKNSEIQSEKKKRRDALDAYKKLKSQYNYLCTKKGLTPENMLCPSSTEVARDSLDHDHNPLRSPGAENKVQNTLVPGCGLTIHNEHEHNLEDNKEVGLNQPSSSSSPVVPQPVSNIKPSPLTRAKRPNSHWRDMRPNKNRNGPDPHDDFLDTPLENIRGNLKKATKEEIHRLPGPVPKDMDFDSSDDETQDVSADPRLQKQQQISAPRPGTNKGFKYVEPVRKKADRENLKGIECKQCKKFYDAVLPDGGGNSGDGNKQNLRCEHHDGVSRHRYRYAPPLTPEGFWNIGFESEM